MNSARQRDVPIPPLPPFPPPALERYAQYERLKRQLTPRNLTPTEYSQAVRQIADWLGV